MRDNSLTYTLIAPAQTITFDPAPIGFNDNARMWFSSIEFNAGIRSEISDRPQAHGIYMDDGRKGGGTLAAEVRIIARHLTLEQKRTALLKALNSMLGEDGSGALYWTNQGGLTPLYLPGLQLTDGPTFAMDGTTWRVSFVMSSEKPFAEDANSTTTDSIALTAGGGGFTIPLTIPITFTSSGGGTVTVTNNGDWGHATPILRVYGPITNPTVLNNTTGKTLVFAGSIASGDFWEISLFDRTVRFNGGVQSQIGSLDVSLSEWFDLGIGSSQLQLTGTGFDANTKLRVLMRSAWA